MANQRTISAELKQMADGLAPSERLQVEVKRIIERLHKIIHSPNFRWHHIINRVVPLGSFAKKSAVRLKMDLDIVVYLNQGEHPFEEFLDDLHDYIIMNVDEDCEKRGPMLTFKAEKTVDVDLLPARNMVPRDEDSRGVNAQQLQYEYMLKFIKSSGNPFEEGWKNGPGLSETAVKFVKQKNERYHSGTVARLAKFWSMTVYVKDFHYGRSTIMEYIAIKAAEMEQSSGRENTLQAFRRFLNIIQGKDEKINVYWTDYYSVSDIDSRMKRSRPLLLDPVNPHNNILRGVTGRLVGEIGQFAEVTLNRLDIEESNSLRNQSIDMISIFAPQPDWNRLPFTMKVTRTPVNFYITCKDGDLLMPKSNTKSGTVKSGFEKSIVENYLFSFTDVVARASRKKEDRDVASSVQREVQRKIAPDSSWGSSCGTTDREVVLEIPVQEVDGRTKIIHVGFDLK